MSHIKKVLVVEDSHIVTKVLRHVIKTDPGIEAVYAASFAEARERYQQHGETLFAALVDLNLPDAPDGEVVDYTLSKNLPTIVLTGSFDEERREKLLSKGIVDYVSKEGRFSYSYAINLVNRLYKNQDIKVLVVDDSETSRNLICDMLERHKYQALAAVDGVDAVRVLLKNPDVKLLITDYQMPNMDGFELVQNIRVKYEKSDLVIIGLSAEGQGSLSAKFIKNGANDFLPKPFNHEEFYCRVMHNVESLELIEQIRDSINRDNLTGLFNRRYFFDRGEELYRHARESGSPLAAVVLDVDYFKQINDRYGHEVGDAALQQFATLLDDTLGRFVLARASGQEFFVLLPGLNNEQAISVIDKVRTISTATPIQAGDHRFSLTFSAGVTNQLCDDLDAQLNLANTYLLRAKDAGRELVIGDEEEE
ncbi:response regulator [Pseudomaricurvus alkylphenolicus]|jgi:diguanylate cyclase (GGDEF)-like protein|uniref:response regulator n=1 Tax=Pseudomaricurvus alkylphenolicus TaxID=1306991 RepID=UPI00141FF12A|nr:response regulator [Pseudomaricurvus alkylphenolicus]NIB41840.1 response regulator [Pseudomaricurvus alkylphenolicus]